MLNGGIIASSSVGAAANEKVVSRQARGSIAYDSRKKTRSSGIFGRISTETVGSSTAPIHDDGVRSNKPSAPRVGATVTDGANAWSPSRSSFDSGTAGAV